ncbi:breast cancer type 2 susceptibility protein isoform X2 [Gadus macrocephalus]|uniref:breast cancer type 2 susceptibility protein isoform X2 n=1 Tax=Gadus macrocephalus TaxID=80720 RepID=UPI0028CB73E0|nr:breast cancer type 2 susceptibility protein isoform X2 [Gadus macrocephalus]
MDASSRNMFDTLKDHIWDNLRQIDPDWFNTLTVKASNEENNRTGQNQPRPAHGGEGFKTPFGKNAVDSQPFSTPKIFRHSRSFLSPGTQHDGSFIEQGKEPLPWAAMGTGLQGTSAERSSSSTSVTKLFRNRNHPNHFELLDTPQRTLKMMASLGAEVNPDVSWTSSLNTPPNVPSTLILSKNEVLSSLESTSDDKNIVFVRKLFPSLADASGVNVQSPSKNPKPNTPQTVVAGRGASQEGTSSDSTHSSLDQGDEQWRQTLPDAIQDKELRAAVAGVLDGAENVLSVFFTNSSSTLRRVKSKERIKRRRKERTRHARRVSVERLAETVGKTEGDENLEGADLCPPAPSTPPGQRETSGGAGADSQWSPISLTEITEAGLDSSVDNLGKQQEPESGHFTGKTECLLDPTKVTLQTLNTADSLFSKKKRQFVYNVHSPLPRGKEEHKPTQKAQQSKLISDQEPCVHRQEPTADVPPSVQGPLGGCGPVPSAVTGTSQDLDMSQLCRALDQDFTQMTEVVKKQQDLFSPSTCLLLVKERNKKIFTNGEASPRETVCPRADKGPELTGYGSNSYAVPDSGILSCATDHQKLCRTSSPVPSIVPKQSFHGANSTGTQKRLVPFTPLSAEKERSLYDEMEEDPPELNQSVQSHSISGIEPLIEEFIGPQGDLGGDVYTERNTEGQTTMKEQYGLGFHPSTSGSSGFKTASNKGIPISSVNLQKARDIFKEVEEVSFPNVPLTRNDESTRNDMNKSILQNDVPVSAIPAVPASAQAPAPAFVPAVLGEISVCNQHRLTASQKAHVTELCSLLEETHTQYDFTPFKPAELNVTRQEVDLSPKATDAELDPDSLVGIVFDDSFSFYAEKHLDENVQIPLGCSNHMVSTLDNESVIPLKKNETSTPINVHTTKRKATLKAVDVSNGHENNTTSYTKLPNHQEKYPLMCNLGFQTAGGKSFSVSKKCLSKAKALFSDLEDGYLPFTDTADGSRHVSVNSGAASTHQQIPNRSSHNIASGVGTSNNLHLDSPVSNTVNSGEKVSITATESPFCPSISSDKPTAEKPGCENSQFHMTKVSELKGGFSTASGRGITISARAVKAASSFFKDLDAMVNQDDAPPQHRQCNAVMVNEKESDCSLKKETSTEPEQRYGEIASACVVPSASLATKSGDDNQTYNGGFKTPMAKDVVSIPRRAPLKERSGSVSSASATLVVGSYRHGGFSTASGKKVSVTGEALAKAQSLLNECDLVEEVKLNIDASTARSLPAPSPKEDCFKPGARRRSALTAKCPCPSSSENVGPSVVSESGSARGFSTASGNMVSVSDKALTKARSLLNENLTDKEKQQAALTGNHQGQSPNPILLKPRGGFQTASGKGVAVSAAALQKAKAMMSDCDAPPTADHQGQSPNPIPGGFQTASGKGVAVSAAAFQKAKAMMSDCDAPPTADHQGQSPNPIPGGFQTASGKGVAVSAAALQKAKAMMSDCDAPPTADHQGQSPNPIPGGFQTASGKGVAVSAAALQKAKAMMSDCDAPPTADHQGQSPNPIPGGFQTASGKGVAVSTSALQKAKAMMSDCDAPMEAPAHSNGPTKAPRPGSGFHAATGKPVQVSSEALQKAKSVFDDLNCDAETVAPSTSTEEKFRECPRNLEGMKLSFTTAKGTIVQVSEDNLLKAKNRLNVEEESVCSMSGANSHLEDNNELEMLDVNTTLLNTDNRRTEKQTTPGERNAFTSTCEDLEGDAQSADTSASVEGRILAAESAPMVSEKMTVQSYGPVNIAGETPNATGKRSIDDADLTGFLNDRRVFKYKVSLEPHITGPHRDGKSFVVYANPKPPPGPAPMPATPPGPLASGSRVPVFVPPFLKRRRTDTPQSNPDPQGTTRARTPAVFIPPFKKPLQPPPPLPLPLPLPPSSPTPAETSPYVRTATITTKSTAMVTETHGDGRGSGCHDSEADGVPGESAATACDPATRNLDVEQDPVDPEGLRDLRLARDLQDMRLRKKKRQTVRPLPGSLFLAKASGAARIPLRAAVCGLPPGRHSPQQLYQHGVHQPVWTVTAENAESFRLSFRRFFRGGALGEQGGVQLADGGWLVPRDDWTLGKEEFYRALCDSPGVDVKLLSQEWAYNHYRWVVWKLASMERSFPLTMASLWLNPEQILLQLKYRYDVEVDHSRRPALRKITERDDAAAKTLVLCVCGVVRPGPDPRAPNGPADQQTPQAESHAPPPGVVWLTDGWYAIKAQLDAPLTAMLQRGRLEPGGKLVVYGAELVGSQDGCSPLEAPEGLMLKIGANSCRRARWDAKLGFQRDPRPFLLRLSSLYSTGGAVGCVDLLILRSYPVLWMEKKQDGVFVFRSGRAEEREARRYDDHNNKTMEALYAKIQADIQREDKGTDPPARRRTLRQKDVEKLRDGEELYEAFENDPAYLEACLNDQQLEVLQSYRRSVLEKRQAGLQERCRRALEQAQDSQGGCPRRDVTPVWKLCVVDARASPGDSVYMLNVWRPPADLQAQLKEGARYRVYNLSVTAGKKRNPGASVQLTATSKTHFQEVQVGQDWLSDHFQARQSVHFQELQRPEVQTPCGEVDLVGYVVTTADTHGTSPVVYLVDGDLNLVKVRCFSSLLQWGLEELVKPATLLALSNLQLSARRATTLPVLYASDLTAFSSNPREAHLQSALAQLRTQTRAQDGFLRRAQETLSCWNQGEDAAAGSSPWSTRPRTPAIPTAPGRPSPAVCVTPLQPTWHFSATSSSTPQTDNPPPPPTSDPKTLRRRRALDYLSRMPSPPPLGPLGSLASPACVKKTFNPPRRSTTPAAVATTRHVVAVETTTPAPRTTGRTVKEQEEEWENDEGLAQIDTQVLHGGGEAS